MAGVAVGYGWPATRARQDRGRWPAPSASTTSGGTSRPRIGAMRELQAAGIRVPADIAVTGFDDIHLGALLTPALTTVHQPIRLVGERACTLLLERIANPALPHRTERLPTRLVIRESCGCSPAR